MTNNDIANKLFIDESEAIRTRKEIIILSENNKIKGNIFIELENYHNDEIKCPYCGYDDSDYDSWESSIGCGDGDVIEEICGRCEKQFKCRINIYGTYDTWKDGEDG